MDENIRQSIEPLSHHKEWFLAALANIGDGVITTNADGIINFLNREATALTGWNPEDAEGVAADKVLCLLCEESHQPIESPVRQVLNSGEVYRLQEGALLVSRDGTERPLLATASPVNDDAAAVMGVVVVFQDITERRLAERALVASAEYAEDIISTLREPFLVLDSALRVKSANPAFYSLFKVDQQHTENCAVYELGDGQWDIPDLRRLLSQVVSDRKPINDYEVCHDFPALGRKTMLLNARAFPPDANNPELLLLAFEDVTDRRQQEEMVTEIRRKDEFLALLAHELRNPLAPISNSMSYLAMEGATPEGIRKAREVIARQLGIMQRLLDDLLDVSRITRNKLDIQKRPVELTEVLEAALEGAGHHLEASGVDLSVNSPPTPVYVNGDPVRLAQVLINLLENASKFTAPNDRVRLGVEVQGDEVLITVQDSGIGIAPENLKQIFSMFTQLDQAPGPGLGIGLSLARKLVEMHGGTLEVHSEGTGQGSIFTIRLPRLAHNDPGSSAEETKSTGNAGDLRVLVVDDNVDSAESMQILLELKGNEVRAAHDGQQALQLAESFQPQIILLDIGLPDMNGYEVAQHVRGEPWGRDIVLIAMTGWGQEEDRRRSREAGINAHLVKPVDIDTIDRLLSDYKTGGAAADPAAFSS